MHPSLRRVCPIPGRDLAFRRFSGSILGVPGPYDDLVDHLVRSSPLSASEAERVVAEVLSYFAEPVQDYVRRRHTELRNRGWRNDRIFAALGPELATRRVSPPALSARQLRRLVYG